MSDLISRQALCEYALNQKDKSVTPNDIMRFPSAQPETHEERTETHACDCISRQAAIDATKRVLGDHEITRTMQTALHILPTIEPEQIVRCKDCKYYRCDGCFFSTAETEEDGFCSWAERKDGSCHEPST